MELDVNLRINVTEQDPDPTCDTILGKLETFKAATSMLFTVLENEMLRKLNYSSYQKDRNFDILFCWIPGHGGITGNDEADAAAKAASSNVETFVPFQDIDQVLKQTILIKWQHIWYLELNNKLHSIQPSIAGFQPNNLNRRMSVKLARLRLGHTYFTHKHLLYADPAPSCSSCSTIISVRHILCECPKYRVLRRKYFGKAYPDLRDILGEPYNANVFSFVHDINFIHSI
ncbi:hypothetical protein AVEN_250913-1 [Araneus ventricosus]|uniref:Uncharacterized protein n=1 Tax=Araneus ventricosus TaxID=182803 RepID=A0A4Y2IMF0_ARAVE|nr:hypothetical protein AVEN_250913-1 [Araneus ventricosus]